MLENIPRIPPFHLFPRKIKDKLGLNLFADRSNAAPMAFVQKDPSGMITDVGEYSENTAFSFISEEDKAKLREAMSLASEMDLKEMNTIAQNIRMCKDICVRVTMRYVPLHLVEMFYINDWKCCMHILTAVSTQTTKTGN